MEIIKRHPYIAALITFLICLSVSFYISHGYFSIAYEKNQEEYMEELRGKDTEIIELENKVIRVSERAGKSFLDLRDLKNKQISRIWEKYFKVRSELKEALSEKEQIITRLYAENLNLRMELFHSNNLISILLFQIDLQVLRHQIMIQAFNTDFGYGKNLDERNQLCKEIQNRLEVKYFKIKEK